MTKKVIRQEPAQPFWGLDGPSLTLLRAQLNKASSPDTVLEIRLQHKATGPDGLTFFVRDPKLAAVDANAVLNDTWHCPPFCK